MVSNEVVNELINKRVNDGATYYHSTQYSVNDSMH
jgi:hypothetical protein